MTVKILKKKRVYLVQVLEGNKVLLERFSPKNDAVAERIAHDLINEVNNPIKEIRINI